MNLQKMRAHSPKMDRPLAADMPMELFKLNPQVRDEDEYPEEQYLGNEKDGYLRLCLQTAYRSLRQRRRRP
jgi:hypothetical protein